MIKQLAWLWWNKEADEKPSEIEVMEVEVNLTPSQHKIVHYPTVTIRAGTDPEGVTNQWSSPHKPFLTVKCDGNGLDVIKHPDRYKEGDPLEKWFRLDYSTAQFLYIALREQIVQKNADRGGREIHKYFKGELKDVLPDLIKSKKSTKVDHAEVLKQVKGVKALRPAGDILLDMEPLILELVEEHDLQWGDILNLVRGYLEVHAPMAQEEYTDESGSPEFYYGPKLGVTDE